jgi:hypothetical protein
LVPVACEDGEDLFLVRDFEMGSLGMACQIVPASTNELYGVTSKFVEVCVPSIGHCTFLL